MDIKKIALSESLGSEEEETHQILRQLIKERSDHERKRTPMEPTTRHYVPALYALDVAEQKMRKVEQKQEDKNIPIIACDVVVLSGERILEKPKDRKEAAMTLKKLSGKEMEISLGAVLLTPSPMGRIFLSEAARMKIRLRRFTDSDIEKYLDDVGDRYLGVAGAIDYADPAAKVFLDDTAPASIEKIEDLRRGTRAGGKSASFSPELLGQMRDYAVGVPRELIQAIINQGKALAA
ncbi:MAG: Maf family protein [Candidatus Liptonbacteria bacterium]|nr:Maf family protein [Candidatus Liptonbacteria bacterium]